MIIEIAANGLESAVNSQAGGAHRIELCADLELGGTTPSAGLIKQIKKHLHIPVYVLLRPRAGDFIYNDYEFETILADIEFCKEEGIDGIVVGFLDHNANIDVEKLEKVRHYAEGLPITFNRAFDMTANLEQALEVLIQQDIARVLTSGAKISAMEGRFMIQKLVAQSKGRISIMPASGINENNIVPLSQFTGAKEFHASSRSLIKSPMVHLHRDLGITIGDELRENDYYVSDLTKIQKIVNSVSLA